MRAHISFCRKLRAHTRGHSDFGGIPEMPTLAGVFTFVPILIALLAVACGAGAPKDVTIDEYGEIICPLEDTDPFGDRWPTWAEMKGEFQDTIKTYESVKPPDDIIVYHEARLELLRAVLAVIDSKHPEDLFNQLELGGDAGTVLAAMSIAASIAELDWKVQETLKEYGCMRN